MFHQYFHANAYQQETTKYLYSLAKYLPEFSSENHAAHGHHEGNNSDDYAGIENRYLQQSEAEAHGKGINARSHR